MNSWDRIEGSPFPLGASWVERDQAYNFALYSKHAESVRLLLYEPHDLIHPSFEYDFSYLQNKSGPIWHCRVSQAQVGMARYYAYRVTGPPSGRGFDTHCFDPDKVLIDPYARAAHFPPGFSREAACRPGSNAGKAPLGLLPTPSAPFDWGDDRPVHHGSDLVIYEMHVRGFTRHPSSGLAEARRGTFLGVIDKIPYLVELGVTAVELMPVFQFDPQEGNYWGYMPLLFFAPHHGYSSDPGAGRQHDEFRAMIRALHSAGIEVILDGVYNHTCEGDHHGPTYSLKGIDSSSFYMMTGDPSSPFANLSGTGNTLHTANRAVRRGILDSLRFWDIEMHVDGFRFDLASIFTRKSDGTIDLDDPPIVSQIGTDIELRDNRLIAEPWDAGGAFQLGKKFPGQRWMQWNARYRDAVQRFVRGDSGLVGELMTRLYGSDDLFPDDRLHAYQPSLSVNYITCHDGFTLYDLVSYEQKRNWANGQGNADGPDEFSWNCGWEGDDGVPERVIELRKRQVKLSFALLMLSNGAVMFRMGDEFLQTQGGNNNPFNQDNETSWLDWRRLESNRDVFRFFACMISFRKTHPSISRSRFWRGDVSWYGPAGAVDLSAESRQFAYCLRGASQYDDDLYVLINGAPEASEFAIQEVGEWLRVVDTARDSPDDFAEPPERLGSTTYRVQGRSVVVLLRERR